MTKSSGQDAALRDHFAENVKSPLLRKEIKKFIRPHPEVSFPDTREEAIRCADEDEKSCGPRPRVASSHETSTSTKPSSLESAMNEMIKTLQGQQKAIEDLAANLKTLNTVSTNSPGSPCIPHWPGIVYERAVGSCPVTTVKLGGVHVRCLLDSGSQVSTITESFFNKHFRPRRSKLLDTNQWLTLTAANGLEIPYIGYLELDFEAQGVTIPQRGILVVRDPPDPQSRARKEAVPGLIGMNIIQRMNQETG